MQYMQYMQHMQYTQHILQYAIYAALCNQPSISQLSSSRGAGGRGEAFKSAAHRQRWQGVLDHSVKFFARLGERSLPPLRRAPPMPQTLHIYLP